MLYNGIYLNKTNKLFTIIKSLNRKWTKLGIKNYLPKSFPPFAEMRLKNEMIKGDSHSRGIVLLVVVFPLC